MQCLREKYLYRPQWCSIQLSSQWNFWIENKNMTGTFNDLLQAGASALGLLTKAQHSLPNRHFGLGIRLVFSCEFGLSTWHPGLMRLRLAYSAPHLAYSCHIIPCFHKPRSYSTTPTTSATPCPPVRSASAAAGEYGDPDCYASGSRLPWGEAGNATVKALLMCTAPQRYSYKMGLL